MERIGAIKDSLKNLEYENIYSSYSVNVIGGCESSLDIYKNSLDLIKNSENIKILYFKNLEEFYNEIENNMEIYKDESFHNIFLFNLNYCRFACKNDNICFIDNQNHICKTPFECIECMCIDESNKDISVKEQMTKDINYITDSIYKLDNIISYGKYTEIIVSDLDHCTIDFLFKLVTGDRCPIASLKQFSIDNDQEQLINKLNNIIKINSYSFRNKWNDTINKLEELQKTSYRKAL
jgi:hypothetical protein